MQKLAKRLCVQSGPILQLNATQTAALSSLQEKLDSRQYEVEQVACLCGRDEGQLVARRDRYALPVDTHLCRHCGTMWTSPRLTDDSLSQFYEHDYRSIYVGHAQAPDSFFNQQLAKGQAIYEFVAPALTHLRSTDGSPRVYDVGCGAGGMLIPFREQGWQVVGCDLGSDYLARGRAAGLPLEQGGPSVLQPYGQADLVILSHVLEHLPEPKQSLHEITDLLVDEGFLYIELPGVFRIHRVYKDTLRFLQNAHLYHFTLRTLSALLADCGYRLVKGDEQIRALFQRDQAVEPVQVADQYEKIWAYLRFMDVFQRIHRPLGQAKQQAKRLFGRSTIS